MKSEIQFDKVFYLNNTWCWNYLFCFKLLENNFMRNIYDLAIQTSKKEIKYFFSVLIDNVVESSDWYCYYNESILSEPLLFETLNSIKHKKYSNS